MITQCYETEYKNFGKCVCLENGVIKLMATVDVGPRIIYFAANGMPNIMFEDINRDYYEMNKGYGTWYNYGGHRLWSSPESLPETYYPDNSRVSFSFENNILTLEPRPTASEKQFRISVEMGGENTVNIKNTIINISKSPKRYAPWSVTSLTGGGIEFVPLNRKHTGLLPNRTVSLWSYSELRDERFTMTDSYAVIRQDPKAGNSFKIGFNITDGYVVYAAENQRFKKMFPGYENIIYPDFMCNFETYTNDTFLGCELLGEQRVYQPGEAAELCETWEIAATDRSPEDTVEECINELDSETHSDPGRYSALKHRT